MGSEAVNELTAVEAASDDLVEQYHNLRHLVGQRQLDNVEVVVGIEHVKVFDDLLIGDVALTERHSLIEDGQCIAHTTIGFFGNHGQRLFLVGDAFLLGHAFQVGDGVLNGHTLEVVDLASRDDGRQNLVLLGRGQDEDDVRRRLLERLQESVEGLLREHVNLVDDKHLVATYLRRYARLLHERLDVLDGVVRGGIEFENIVRTLLVERLARLAMVAGLAFLGRRQAVDGLGKDACTGGLSNASWTAEEVGMSQFSTLHRILQRRGQRALSDHRVEGHRAVLSC